MNISNIGNTGNGTYFVTSCTYQKKSVFQTDKMAGLFLDVLQDYRPKGYFLHEFVLMPDLFHILLTPLFTLEKALQFIKGGFSFRASKAGHIGPIWEKSFHDRRVRDWEEYQAFCKYIRQNPVKRGLSATPESYIHGSAANQAGDGSATSAAKAVRNDRLTAALKRVLHPKASIEITLTQDPLVTEIQSVWVEHAL